MVERGRLVRFLDSLLQPERVKDATWNGLQVEGDAKVHTAAFAVDSCQDTFLMALESGAEMLVVHHGLIWGGWKKITGTDRKRLEILLSGRISLYVSHLPLDIHPTIGNNARLIGLLKARRSGTIGEAGLIAEFSRPVPFSELAGRVASVTKSCLRTLEYGRGPVRRLGVCSGSVRPSFLQECLDAGVNTVLTGEGSGESLFRHPARENGMNVIFAGHYETETFGVKALKEAVERKFGKRIRTVFLDLPGGRTGAQAAGI